MTSTNQTYWTNPSVLALDSENPLSTFTTLVRSTIYKAIENGWLGPPYDPFQLAEYLKVPVTPTEYVLDARTVPVQGGGVRVEYNPNRPLARTRFSIAHEIAHTLFPDCAYSIRNRSTHTSMADDEWQLEMLCNMGAAEILMPAGSLKQAIENVTFDGLLELRQQYSVSAEAMLLQVVRLAETELRCFAPVERRWTHQRGMRSTIV